MKICRARKHNLDKINEVVRSSKSDLNYPEHYLQAALTILKVSPSYIDQNLCFEVLNSENAIVGFFAISEEHDGIVLDHLWIEPKVIGQGFGRKAMEFIEALANKESWPKLLVLPDPEATAFYLRFGFVETGLSRPSRVEGGPTFKLLEKKFPPKLGFI